MTPHQILRNLLEATYQLNPVGTLSNLRLAHTQLRFAGHSDQVIADTIVGAAHLAAFNLSPANGPLAADYLGRAQAIPLLISLKRLAQLYNQPGTLSRLDIIGREKHLDSLTATSHARPFRYSAPRPDRTRVDQEFRSYCDTHNLSILRILQPGIDRIRHCSWVYLVRDTDHLVKVFKEVLTPSGPIAHTDREDRLYELLPPSDYFPRLYGVVNTGNFIFMRQSVHFGQSLADYIVTGSPLPPEDAAWIMHGLCETVEFLHLHGIAHLDLKPENVLVNPNGVRLLDLGVSRRVVSGSRIDIYLPDPRYATPECGSSLTGSQASDIYQLGLLYHQLLTGRDPFDLVPFEAEDLDRDRESAILRYLLPRLILPYTPTNSSFAGEHTQLITSMLATDPAARPDIAAVKSTLTTRSLHTTVPHPPRRNTANREHNTVLFPARMGIPHRGHIEYMTRILELGYHLAIAIEHNHTLTPRDPIHKFFVGKMVARSLSDRGFVPQRDFTIFYTPLYRTLPELVYHYQTHPAISDVVAVASGNPMVHDLFAPWPILDQESVFGHEGENWDTLSWGEILRTAVRNSDLDTFHHYAASGVTPILTLSQLRDHYASPLIDFAAEVHTVLLSEDNQPIVSGRVFRYDSAEDSLIRHLHHTSPGIRLLNRYAPHTLLEINGEPVELIYSHTQFDPATLRESIFFHIIHTYT